MIGWLIILEYNHQILFVQALGSLFHPGVVAHAHWIPNRHEDMQGWSTMYLLAILDSVLKNIGEACAVLVIYAAQAGR